MITLYYAGMLLLLCMQTSLQATKTFTFDDCSIDSGETFTVDHGALVKSQEAYFYSTWQQNCSYTFQVPERGMQFLVQITLLDIRGPSFEQCEDSLSVIGLHSWHGPKNPVFSDLCQTLSGVQKLYSYTPMVQIVWKTGRSPSVSKENYRGFNIVLTALYHRQGACDVEKYMQCGQGDCMHKKLQCDHVRHCYNGLDEKDCFYQAMETSTPSITPSIHHAGNPSHAEPSDIFLWLPLIVVVVFTVVLLLVVLRGKRTANSNGDEPPVAFLLSNKSTTQVTPGKNPGYDMMIILVFSGSFMVVLLICLVLGCREQRARQQGENQTDTLNLNTNPGYDEDGVPDSPPPTYNMIARQTSYVSYISQSSSQLEIPPEYDDAKDFPDSASGVHPRGPSRQISRLSSTSPARNRRPGFRRSISTEERRRRPRMFSQRSVPGDSRRPSHHRHVSDSILQPEPHSPVLISVSESPNDQPANLAQTSATAVNVDSATDNDVFENGNTSNENNANNTGQTRVSFF